MAGRPEVLVYKGRVAQLAETYNPLILTMMIIMIIVVIIMIMKNLRPAHIEDHDYCHDRHHYDYEKGSGEKLNKRKRKVCCGNL